MRCDDVCNARSENESNVRDRIYMGEESDIMGISSYLINIERISFSTNLKEEELASTNISEYILLGMQKCNKYYRIGIVYIL